MARISGVLGIDDACVPRREQEPSASVSPTDEFYRNFLVPRLVASAGQEPETVGKERLSSVTTALKELVGIYLREESGEFIFYSVKSVVFFWFSYRLSTPNEISGSSCFRVRQLFCFSYQKCKTRLYYRLTIWP